ncbi:hypothetical protein PsYK624_147110 [Phanerochaete sordida]|uniref:CxC2-like cysteine cluster KDZ transposase-associated domain-containing protein n=1 Tax=Phanerochaete sordida TaxID=48140 RepID=A0A9P3GSB0_9APHY|nr:hypothetical protein PsYK624_147110 [Phanerochaete sordida]
MRRKTDNVAPHEVTNRYREFMTATRTFSHITDLKRHGRKLRDLVYASLAVLCPACPQPDMNMEPGWRERNEELRFLDALFYAVDGNFHANLKDKRMDHEDFPLSKGAAYFADETAFAAFSEKLPPLGPEPSTCHKFEAMGHGPYWGKVSGTVGMFCARHMMVMPGGHVDLQKGERFINVDFASVSGLQRWMDLLLHYSAYDVNCQHRLYFEERLEKLWEMLEDSASAKLIPRKDFPQTIAGVGKFHALGHNADCRTRWGFGLQPGSNQVDGEAPERMWPSVNALGTRTREMNPGNRHDHMNQHYGDQNIKRVHNMPRYLCRKLAEARPHVRRVTKTLQKLEKVIDAHYGPEKLQDWRQEEEEWMKKVIIVSEKKDLPNLYDLTPRSAKTMKEIEREIEGKYATIPFGRDLAGVIEEGITLQESKIEILTAVERHKGEDAVNEMWEKFEKSWKTWQSRHANTLSPLIAQASSETKTEATDNVGDSDDSSDDDTDYQPGNTSDDCTSTSDTSTDEMNRYDGDLGTHVNASGDSDFGDDLDPQFKDGSDDDLEEELFDLEQEADEEEQKNMTGKGKGKGKRARGRKQPTRKQRSERWKAINDIEIILPSSLMMRARQRECMADAVEIEIALRVGQANEALTALRTHLITSYTFKNRAPVVDQKKMKQGQYMSTRSKTVIHSKDQKIQGSANEYRRAYSALISLGYEDKENRLKPLEKDDIKAFVVSMGDQELGYSKGNVKSSWIWQELEFLDTDEVESQFSEYSEEVVKVHWFRVSALRARWWEEQEVVLEEMRRTVRFFKYHHWIWLERGSARELEGLLGEAAYARKQAYRYERLIDGCRIMFQDIPEIDTMNIRHYAKTKDGKWIKYVYDAESITYVAQN